MNVIYKVCFGLFLLVFISSCTKNNEFTFIDIESPEAASGLSWGLISSSSETGMITAKWKVAEAPDVDFQNIQFFSDEKCSTKLGEEVKLDKNVSQYGLPVSSSMEGPYTYSIRTMDKNGNASLSSCSQAFKIFETQVSSVLDRCLSPETGADVDKVAELNLPKLNPFMPFLDFAKITIKDLETQSEFEAQSFSKASGKFSFVVPRSKRSDLVETSSGSIFANRNLEITYQLNTGYEFKANSTIGLDAKGPPVALEIDPVYSTKFYDKNCNLADSNRNCEKFIPIQLKELEHSGCARLADEPFQISFVDSRDIEVNREPNFFKEKSKQVEWTLESFKRARVKITVKNNLGTDYFLLSENLYNSGFQYIAGVGFDGDGELATLAKLTDPQSIAYNRASDFYCFFEPTSSKIRCSRPGGRIFTVVGNGAKGLENEEKAMLTGADPTKMSLPNMSSLQFIGNDLYFFSESRILRKISLEYNTSEGRVKVKQGSRFEAITPYFSEKNSEIKLKCKNYSIPGVCSLNQEITNIPESLGLFFNGFYYDPSVEVSAEEKESVCLHKESACYFNKSTVYLLSNRILYKYDIPSKTLEPLLGIGKFEKDNGDAPSYIAGVVANKNLELFSARAVIRGPGNTLIVSTVRQDNVRKGSHNVILLSLEGAPADVQDSAALNDENIKAPYAKYIFKNGNLSWPSLAEYFKDLKGGSLVFVQSNDVFNRVVAPLNSVSVLPIDLEQNCNGCRFRITHENNDVPIRMSQNTQMTVRSVNDNFVQILGVAGETAEILEHRLPFGSQSSQIQESKTFNVLAGYSFENIPTGVTRVNNLAKLDRPAFVTMDRKSNHLYFMDGAGQDIKKLDMNSRQISSFYGLNDYRIHRPNTTYNFNNFMLTFREKDESLLFAFRASSNNLYKKKYDDLDRNNLPTEVLSVLHKPDTDIIPDGTKTKGSENQAAVFGLFTGTSYLEASRSGNLFIKDYRYRVTETIPQYARLYKVLPCDGGRNDSCTAINDNEGRSFFVAGKEVNASFPVVPNSNLSDVTLGLSRGFTLDKDEGIYLYNESTVYVADYKNNIIEDVVSIPEGGRIIQVTVGDSVGADGKDNRKMYVLLLREDLESEEDVFDPAPGRDNLKQTMIRKYLLYSVELKKGGNNVANKVLKYETDFGEGSLQSPREMLVDNEGNVIIAEAGANRILRYYPKE